MGGRQQVEDREHHGEGEDVRHEDILQHKLWCEVWDKSYIIRSRGVGGVGGDWRD